MFIGLYGNGSKIRAVKRACEDESCSNELVSDHINSWPLSKKLDRKELWFRVEDRAFKEGASEQNAD